MVLAADREMPSLLPTVAILLGTGACARTVVRPHGEVQNVGLPRPAAIVVYDFAVSDAELHEKQLAPVESDLGHDVANALAEELAHGLGELGFTVVRKPRGTAIENNELLIDGEFLDIGDGNMAERLVIGFGAGASKVDTADHVYYGAARKKVLDFRTHADSGKMPGAAATMGVGVAATGAVTATMWATSAATGGLKEYKSVVARMGAKSGQQAVGYLSTFFYKQGWIKQDQVKKTKIDK